MKNDNNNTNQSSAIIVAGLFFIVFVLLSYFLSKHLARQEKLIEDNNKSENIALIKYHIANNINTAITSLRRMSSRWTQERGTPKNQWEQDAINLIEDFDGLNTIQWVDNTYHVRWVQPVMGNEKTLGLNIAFNQTRKDALKDAEKINTITITPPLKLIQGYSAFISYIPIYIDNKFDGFIVGIFSINDFFEHILSEEQRNQYHVWVFDQNQPIFKTVDAPSIEFRAEEQSAYFDIYNRKWSIILKPKLINNDTYFSSSAITLILGLILSFALAFCILAAILSYKRNKLLSKQSIDLQNSNERYRSILENSEIGLLTVDKLGNIETFNRKCELLYGYKADEVVNRQSSSLIADSYHNDFKHFMAAFFEDGEAYKGDKNIELEGIHKDGTLIPLELSLSEIIIDGERKLNLIIIDTIERVKEERILNELYAITISSEYSFNEKLNKVLEFGREYFELSMGIISRIEGDNYEVQKVSPLDIMDEGSRFNLTNTYCAHTFKTKEVKSWHNTGLSEISDHPCYKNFGLESYIGTTIYVDDQAYGTVNFTDPAPRKHPFTKKQKTFVNVIAQWLGAEIYRNQSLEIKEKLIDRLNDSNEELERFAYVCSHDLQEPLRTVKSFSELLEEHLESILAKDELAKKYFSFVIEGAARSQQLIKDILSYSKIDHDTNKRELIGTNELLKTIEKNMQVNLEQCSGKITYDKLPTILGNKTQIYQLFQNLINNGLKYRKPNVNPHVHISAKENSDQYEFSVSDNGIGIRKEYADKVFEVFQRLHKRDEYSGTGIGLSICKKIVSRHSGKISVVSKEGSGSTFRFTIKKST